MVKVQRPNAPRQIEADLALMYQAAQLAKERIRALDFIDTNEIVDEFDPAGARPTGSRQCRLVPQELRRSSYATVPRVTTAHCGHGYRRSSTEVQLAPRPRALVAEGRRSRLIEARTTMIFRHGFFHGDPHRRTSSCSPGVGLVDFGLIKNHDEDMSKQHALFNDAARESRCSRAGSLTSVSAIEGPRQFTAAPSSVSPPLRRNPSRSTRSGHPREADLPMNLRLPTRRRLERTAIATLGSVELYPEFNVLEVAAIRAISIERFTPRRVASREARGLKLTQMAAGAPYQIHDTSTRFATARSKSGSCKGPTVPRKPDPLVNRLVPRSSSPAA